MEIKLKRGEIRLDQLCNEIEGITNIKLMKKSEEDIVHGYVSANDDEVVIHLYEQEDLDMINQEEGDRPDLQVSSGSIDKQQISQLVLNHTPRYNCRFCGLDQGSVDAIIKHESICFREKYLSAKSLGEKIRLRDLRDGLIKGHAL